MYSPNNYDISDSDTNSSDNGEHTTGHGPIGEQFSIPDNCDGVSVLIDSKDRIGIFENRAQVPTDSSSTRHRSIGTYSITHIFNVIF